MSTLLEQASLVMIPSGYKEDVVYSQIPTNGNGDLSFTRASNGTRINSAGLVEVCPWNLLQYSEDFANGVWTTYQSSITSNSTTAPNGTNTADSLIDNTSNDQHLIQQGVVTSAGTHTISVYAKANTLSHAWMKYFDGTSAQESGIFNLTNATVSGSGSIESVGNGWCRLSLQVTTLANTGYFYILTSDGTNKFYAGTGKSIYIWGYQLNIGSTAKPYFPTTDRLNVPRLTYQNGGGGCPSLLLEKQSTNLITYSEQFDNAAFSTANNNGTVTRTANYGISPDGTQNADRIQLTRGSGSFDYAQVYQQVSTTSGTHTFSCWIKSLSGTPSIGWAYDGAVWNVVTLTNEWVRYTWTTSTSTTPSANLIIYGSLATPLSADFLVWGYQIEASSYPTSYIPTTSSSATRVADACYKNSISSLIGQSSGVVFADIVPFQFFDGSYIGISDNGLGNRQIFGFEAQSGNSGTLRFYGFYTGNYGTFYAGQRYKIAMAYANNDFVIYVNGTQVVNQTSGTVAGTLSHFGFDSYISSSQNFQGQVNEAILFPTRLTNAELASITSL